MTDIAPPGTGGNGQAPSQIQVRVAAQYIKDLSFENPNIERLMTNSGENPQLEIQVNVNARQAAPNLYESAIEFSAQAKNPAGVLYDLEVVYAGLFQVQNMPAEMLEPFLLVNCPALIFPFLRRLLADITREGGFPPLLLDPIDFGQLYMSRQNQAKTASNDNPTMA